jgi:hypothetical protein
MSRRTNRRATAAFTALLLLSLCHCNDGTVPAQAPRTLPSSRPAIGALSSSFNPNELLNAPAAGHDHHHHHHAAPSAQPVVKEPQ